jgi:hypothetical protein
MSILMAQNKTWQKYAPTINERILAKQQEQQDRQEQHNDRLAASVEKIADKPSVVIDSAQDVIADGGKKIVQNINTDKKK